MVTDRQRSSGNVMFSLMFSHSVYGGEGGERGGGVVILTQCTYYGIKHRISEECYYFLQVVLPRHGFSQLYGTAFNYMSHVVTHFS